MYIYTCVCFEGLVETLYICLYFMHDREMGGYSIYMYINHQSINSPDFLIYKLITIGAPVFSWLNRHRHRIITEISFYRCTPAIKAIHSQVYEDLTNFFNS